MLLQARCPESAPFHLAHSAPRGLAGKLPREDLHALSSPGAKLPLRRDPPSRDIASRFGRRIRELRVHHGMTQVEVATAFGIDRTFISDVERGRKSVCLPTLEVFALGFGLSLSDLLRDL